MRIVHFFYKEKFAINLITHRVAFGGTDVFLFSESLLLFNRALEIPVVQVASAYA